MYLKYTGRATERNLFLVLTQEWMGEVSKYKIECWVDDPQTFGSMFSRYTSYRMRTKDSKGVEADIRRRFSDFVWLHDVMEAKFVGMILPCLPEKRSVGNLGQEFIAKRMRGLQIFCARLVKIPFLRSDGAVWTFLYSDGSDWEELRKLSAKEWADGGKYAKTPCAPEIPLAPVRMEGAVRWRAAVQAYPLPHNSDLILSEAQRQVIELDQAMIALVHSGRRLVERQVALAEEARAFQHAFGQLASVEEACAEGTWHPKAAQDLAMVERMGSRAVASYAHTLRHQPREMEAFMLEFLRYEQQQCASVRQLLETRDMLRARHGKAAKELVRARASAGSSATVHASTMAQAEFAELFITRALLASELDRWARERLVGFREMLGILGAGEGMTADKLTKLWAKLLDEALPAAVRRDPDKHRRACETAQERATKAIRSVQVALRVGADEFGADNPGEMMEAPKPDDEDDELTAAASAGGGGGGISGWFSGWMSKDKDKKSKKSDSFDAGSTPPPSSSSAAVPPPPAASTDAEDAPAPHNPFAGATMAAHHPPPPQASSSSPSPDDWGREE